MAVVEEKKFENEVKSQDIAIKADQTSDVSLWKFCIAYHYQIMRYLPTSVISYLVLFVGSL